MSEQDGRPADAFGPRKSAETAGDLILHVGIATSKKLPREPIHIRPSGLRKLAPQREGHKNWVATHILGSKKCTRQMIELFVLGDQGLPSRTGKQ